MPRGVALLRWTCQSVGFGGWLMLAMAQSALLCRFRTVGPFTIFGVEGASGLVAESIGAAEGAIDPADGARGVFEGGVGEGELFHGIMSPFWSERFREVFLRARQH